MENIKLNYPHAKSLINSGQFEAVKNYIKLFFFRFSDKIFYYDGTSFILHERDQALKMIPSDFSIIRMVPNSKTNKFEKEEFSLKNYLKETEFMSIEYKPIISFENPRIFTKTINVQGYDMIEHYINMAKPMNATLTTIQANRIPKVEIYLKVIYDHIFEVLCSKNQVLYEYLLNFFQCYFWRSKAS